jgi:hypothetical protein
MWEVLLSVREERIHAHVCGDGHLYVEKGERGRRYVVEYTNKCSMLIDEFVLDSMTEFNASPTILRHRGAFIARFKSRKAFNRLKNLGAGNSREWRAPMQMFNVGDPQGTIELIGNWLRAFFDDEAYVDLSTRRVAITSVNSLGLSDVRKMLTYLGIECKIYTISGGYAYRLVVSGRRNLKKLFNIIPPPLHPLKRTRLRRLVETP